MGQKRSSLVKILISGLISGLALTKTKLGVSLNRLKKMTETNTDHKFTTGSGNDMNRSLSINSLSTSNPVYSLLKFYLCYPKKMMKSKIAEKGFSLVEVLIAAGVASGVALTIAQLSRDSARVNKTAEANNEINSFMSNVAYILSDKVSCNATIAGNETIGSSISAIRKVKDGSTSNVYELDPKRYGNNSFSITGIRTALESNGSASLLFDINRSNLTTFGSRQITKKIPLKAVIVDGKITSCFSDTEDMIETAVEASCQGDAAKYDPVNKQCFHETVFTLCGVGEVLKQVETDDGKIKNECVSIIPEDKICGPGEYLKAIRLDGTVDCGSLATKNPTSCGQGQYARRIVDGDLECVDIPKCGPKEILKSNSSTGELYCLSLPCDPVNQYFAGLDNSGAAICKNFPNESCGIGQYIKEIRNDGTIICGEVPNHLSLPRLDYSFVDGFDTSTKSWPRKNINQVAQQLCSKFQGHTWSGSQCVPPQEINMVKLLGAGTIQSTGSDCGNVVCKNITFQKGWNPSKLTGSGMVYYTGGGGSYGHYTFILKNVNAANGTATFCWDTGGDFKGCYGAERFGWAIYGH